MFDGRLLAGVGVFAAVVETGSFVRTSEVVGLTTSGVSRAISRLEERLGARLFHRGRKGISVTEDGRRFYEQTMPLLVRLADSADQIRACGSGVAGTLRLRADSASSQYLVIPVLREFADAHPTINVQLDERDGAAETGGRPFDAAIHFGGPALPGMTSVPLLDSEIVLCATRAHLDCSGTPRDPADIRTQDHLCLVLLDDDEPSSDGWELHREGRSVRASSDRRLAFNTPTSLVSAIRSGTGIGAAPLFMVQDDLRSGKLVRVLADWELGTAQMHLHLPGKAALTPRAKAFADFLLRRGVSGTRAPESAVRAKDEFDLATAA